MTIPGINTDQGEGAVPITVAAGDTFVVRANTQVPYFDLPTVDPGGSLVVEPGALFYPAGQVLDYTQLINVPSTFTPASHTHGNITNAGAIGSTANLPLITGASGVLQVGSFGSTANTFCQGNDSRLSDARTPTSHTHGNITNAGAIGSTANLPLITGASGVLQVGSFGTTANTFAEGNDTRLSDATTAKTRTDTGSITIRIDGGGLAITTGNKLLRFRVPYACTITGWELVADQSGSIVIDIWKDTYANFPPTSGDTITGSAKPTLSSENKAQSTTLTGWATSLSAGDYLEINVDSATTVQVVALTLTVSRA
jgi:hypothetical protein